MKLMRAGVNEEIVEISHFKSVERTVDPLFASSDETLAEMAKSNEQALTVLYRRHIDRIARYVAHHIRSKHDAEDVTSQVFMAMVRGLPKWKDKQVPFVAWLYRLATNAIYSWMRRQRFRKWIGLGSDPTTNAIVPQDDIEEVRFALQQLPEPFQQTLALHYLEQLSVTTVAQVLGIAEGTVKSRLTRGRALLKELLEKRQK
jgi:RNA polymerase sigma-70 factor (ECF subfamily)